MKQSNADIIKALTTIRTANAGKNRAGLFSGLLMMVFLAILLLALFLGVSVYQHVATAQLASDQGRLGKQLLANNIRSKDGSGTVRIGNGPEGRSLVLVEELESGTYETRIYLSNGQIVQEYAFAGAAYNPDKAIKLVDSSKFLISYDSGLVTIVTDQGASEIALRSMQVDQ